MSLVVAGAQVIATVTDPDGLVHKLGRLRSISISETFNREPVYGLGHVNPQELVLTQWTGTMSAEEYLLLMDKSLLRAFKRTEQNVESFFEQLLFDVGIDLVLVAKREVNGVIQQFKIAKAEQAFLVEETLTINENVISGRNGSFQLLNPFRFVPGELPGPPISE